MGLLVGLGWAVAFGYLAYVSRKQSAHMLEDRQRRHLENWETAGMWRTYGQMWLSGGLAAFFFLMAVLVWR